MPSGRTHDRITLWSLPIVAAVSLWATRSSTLTLAVVGGFLFGGLMLGPDLDTRSIHHQRWGWFRWIWIPYRNSISHRSPLSHGPVIGSTIRVIYLTVVVGFATVFALAAFNEVLGMGWTWGALGQLISARASQYRQVAIAAAVGLEAGALGHYASDWALSSAKQVRKRYPKEGWRSLLIPFRPSKSRKAKSPRARGSKAKHKRPLRSQREAAVKKPPALKSPRLPPRPPGKRRR